MKALLKACLVASKEAGKQVSCARERSKLSIVNFCLSVFMSNLCGGPNYWGALTPQGYPLHNLTFTNRFILDIKGKNRASNDFDIYWRRVFIFMTPIPSTPPTKTCQHSSFKQKNIIHYSTVRSNKSVVIKWGKRILKQSLCKR